MSTPNTISYSGKRLEEMKKGNKVPKEVLEKLKERAEEHLNAPVIAVVFRKAAPPTKNPHEYASIAPFWWPNPDTEDGLPYIRKDGLINPMYFDDMSFEIMANTVSELSLAAYYFEREKYAERAEKMIFDWFLNPDTYMEPHAEYAQSIPGVCDGRGIGLIEFIHSYKIFDGIAILQSMNLISPKTVEGVKAWYRKFSDWMITSEKGISEDIQPNNHGTWYDTNLLSIAIFTERKSLIDKICSTAYFRRCKQQVEKDGSQPLELERTTAMHYCLYNGLGMALIGNMAQSRGYAQYWEADKEFGKCLIKSSVDYIYPFILAPETFPYTEIRYEAVGQELCKMLTLIDGHFPGEGYAEKAKPFIKEPYIWLAQPLV